MAEACRDLVFREWWTDEQTTSAPNGECRVPAFYGAYRITAEGFHPVKVMLTKKGGNQTVRLTPQ